MMVPAETNRPSSERPLRFRVRPDLVAQYQSHQGQGRWILKDPLALKYYRFEEEEYALLQLLDGQRSLAVLQAEFSQRYAPQTITLAELHQFLARLHHHSLVVSDAPGQGAHLIARHQQKRSQRHRSVLTHLLWWRFSGIDPHRLLGVLNHYVGWCFAPPAMLFALLGISAAVLLIVVEFDQFMMRLPSFHDFFGPRNWLLLAATWAGTKVLHELGHGMSCRRYGGECHEMGVMLMLLTPCLYCDVSDSWMIPSKWRRAMVGAAGMYFELVLAAMCTFLWWFTHPGLLHYVCLNIMFMSSVSTLLFNANPLLRYDGYYILSDLIEIPNLRQKSQQALEQWLATWFLGWRTQRSETPGLNSPFLTTFGLASLLYRWMVTISILLFLSTVLAPFGLQSLGQLIACLVGASMILAPVRRLVRNIRTPGSLQRMSKVRSFATMTLTASVLVAVLLWPWPHFVRCPILIQPHEAATIYAEVSGRLQQLHVTPGQFVTTGQPLATLDSLDLGLLVTELDMRRLQLETRRAHLLQRSLQDESAALEVDELTRTLAAIDSQYHQRQTELENLVLRSPREGWVLPASYIPQQTPVDQLRRWAGHPLQPHNLGATLSEGESLCLVGDPESLTATLIVQQSDLEFLQPGQPVRLFLDCLPGTRFRTELEYVSRRALQIAPRSLSSKAGGEVTTTTDAQGHERPVEATYQASTARLALPSAVVPGVTGSAKVYVGETPLIHRLWRLAHRTFRFH
jgi:putative peptide zinc metalloprotease protein